MASRTGAAGPAPEAAHSFEEALERLKTIAEELDAGALSLEQSLGRFEEGVRLVRFLTHTLDQAEKRLERLTQEQGRLPATEPLELDLERGDRGPSSGKGELPF